MINYLGAYVTGWVNRIFWPSDVNNKALIEEWTQWAQHADPSIYEGRAKAVERLIGCLQQNKKELCLSYLNLTSLPVHLPPTIEKLVLENNLLTRLPDQLPASLKLLNINSNQLKKLPAQLPPTLERLYASHNELESLPTVLPSGLKTLSIHHNRLEQLPALPVHLTHLVANSNQLNKLPALLSGSLEELNVKDNRLTWLPELPVSLQIMNIEGNQLNELPSELPLSLQYFNVSHNDLEALPAALPAGLIYLYVNDNQLRRLPDLPSSLRQYNIRNNPFEQLPAHLSHFLSRHVNDTIESVVSDFTDNVQAWKAIGKEAYITDFRLFLEQLQAGPNNQDSVVLKQRVGDWLDYLAKEENRALRANTFLIAQEASASCVDRASFYFNKMYLLMREDQLIKTDTPVVELFNTNLGLFRLQQLEKIATQQAEARSALSSDFKEELEIYLAYECLLREELSLPIYSELQFSEIAGLTQDDLTRAKNEIEQQEKAGFIGYLMNESASWQARLTQWDRQAVESVEEVYLDFIGSDEFNQQVNRKLMEDKIDIHDADAHRERAKWLAESVLYQQRYQLTREFLAAQGELALLDGFNRQYAPLDV